MSLLYSIKRGEKPCSIPTYYRPDPFEIRIILGSLRGLHTSSCQGVFNPRELHNIQSSTQLMSDLRVLTGFLLQGLQVSSKTAHSSSFLSKCTTFFSDTFQAYHLMNEKSGDEQVLLYGCHLLVFGHFLPKT